VGSSIPFEVASVALGLFLLLVMHWYTFGTLMLLGFVCVDSFVRIRHYQRVGPEIHGPMLDSHR